MFHCCSSGSWVISFLCPPQAGKNTSSFFFRGRLKYNFVGYSYEDGTKSGKYLPYPALKWLVDTNNNRIYGCVDCVVVLKFCTIDDNWRFRNFWAICNTDDRQQQVLLRHEDKWDDLPQPRMTNQADDLARKFGWFNVILSMKSMIQPSWLEI